MSFFAGFLVGLFTFIGYVAYRATRSKGWDDSNITNVLRLISHVALHPEDFGKMWYITKFDVPYKRPFHYIDKDELSEVVESRP